MSQRLNQRQILIFGVLNMKLFKSRSSNSPGFSLIEVLLVISIILIIASIFIPNWIDAIHKAKQKRTMAELNQIGNAWMSWLADQVGVASAGAAKTYDAGSFTQLTYQQLFGYLHPSNTFFYLDTLPERDAWGSQISYYQNPNLGSDSQLMICAAARDDTFDICANRGSLPVGPFLSTDFDQDIVWADGVLLRWPETR